MITRLFDFGCWIDREDNAFGWTTTADRSIVITWRHRDRHDDGGSAIVDGLKGSDITGSAIGQTDSRRIVDPVIGSGTTRICGGKNDVG